MSSFMFLVNVNEALGYSHRETLDSSYLLILGLLREHAFRTNERNRALFADEGDSFSASALPSAYVEMVDFSTGRIRRYPKQQSV